MRRHQSRTTRLNSSQKRLVLFSSFYALACAIVFSVIFPSAVHAASLMVSYTGDDTVGQGIAYSLREAVASSYQHKLVYTEEDAGFVIILVTVSDDDDAVASYSAVLTMPQLDHKGFRYFITSIAGNCGRQRVTSCGKNILSSFDKDIQEIVAVFARSIRKPNQ